MRTAAAGAADFGIRVSDSLNNFFSGAGAASKSTPLKDLLETGSVKDALDAMKRVVSMMSKGQDMQYLFPNVVKHVVSPNMEVKKLVYVYLARYAEEQPDVALLSINSFQKDLKGPNQYIRASALRVLSSIRVEVVVPLIMLAVKETVSDMSPYVRKVTAHAIPRIYSLDPSQKDGLVDLIEMLLDDSTVLVLSSAIVAFEAVCPERLDLLHKHFQKLRSMVLDMDEWGQISCLKLLTRYARTQFLDPNLMGEVGEVYEKPFYSDSDSAWSDSAKGGSLDKGTGQEMDADHISLLRTVRPLLQSKNSGVVTAVATMFYAIAPKTEARCVAPSLVSLLYGPPETAYVGLDTIDTISAEWPSLFKPHLKSFFVKNDPTSAALVKIRILVNIADQTNVAVIQRELMSYVRSGTTGIGAAAIHAMGQCALRVTETNEATITSLTHLLSFANEEVVAASIVVIQSLLHNLQQGSDVVVMRLAKMYLRDKITVPQAKASVLWLIGENLNSIPRLAPDVLRLAAKSFVHMTYTEKLQTLNLGAKMMVRKMKKSRALLDHILTLAKYDVSYDLRDKARLLRHLLFSSPPLLHTEHLEGLIATSKPAPGLAAMQAARLAGRFELDTLSHILQAEMPGYGPLPPFPTVAPDPGPRQVEWKPSIGPISRAGGFDMFAKQTQPPQADPAKGFYDSSDEEYGESTWSQSGSSFYSHSDSENESAQASVSSYGNHSQLAVSSRSARASASSGTASGSYSDYSDSYSSRGSRSDSQEMSDATSVDESVALVAKPTLQPHQLA